MIYEYLHRIFSPLSLVNVEITLPDPSVFLKGRKKIRTIVIDGKYKNPKKFQSLGFKL